MSLGRQTNGTRVENNTVIKRTRYTHGGSTHVRLSQASRSMNNTFNTTQSPLPPQNRLENKVKLGFYILTMVLGLIGNVLVLLVVLAKKTRLRAVNDIFIMNLAIADLVLIFILPVHIYLMFHEQPLNVFFCNIYKPFATVSFFVSIFTLTSMAIHRCHVILNPFVQDIRQRTAVLWIGLIWFFSFILLSPMMIMTDPSTCEENWPSKEYGRAYTALLFVFQYVLPLLIIAVAYVRIGLDLNKSRPLCFIWLRSGEERRQEDRSGPEYKERRRENAQVIKTLAIIVVLFALCLLPIQVGFMLQYFGGQKGEEMASVIFNFSLVLAVFHSCLNPLVYGTITKRFRHDYIKYLSYLCRCCKLPAFQRQKKFPMIVTDADERQVQHFSFLVGDNSTKEDASLIVKSPQSNIANNNCRDGEVIVHAVTVV